LGRVIVPSLNSKALVEVMNKAPGTVAAPAACLNFGINLYEMANEVQTLLQILSSSRKPVVFTGAFTQLQSVFHGGQGGASDPMLPVVRRAPKIPIESLIHFTIDSVGQKWGGLPAAMKKLLFGQVQTALSEIPASNQIRVLPALINRDMNALQKGLGPKNRASHVFAMEVHGLTETFSGLSDRPRVERRDQVQTRLNEVLTRPGLADVLKSELLAQDEAIDRLVARLRMECLTRPGHQPIRYCAQGTPATGKSQSAVLLARELDIPFINIDAASIPDFYTASAQLLGSGRGIVGSYQSGRLEQAAKHHAGALVEVSDLDHAPPQVRSALADLFLQVLETGEAQSAAGSMFSCANLVFAFTINLPNGMDEAVRKRIGFQDHPSEKDIQGSVLSEIKSIFSSAFLSRIGTPILFRPLDGQALSVIVERVIRSSILSAAGRMGIELEEIVIDKRVGSVVIERIDSHLLTFGARAILEHARMLAAEAFLEFRSDNPPKKRKTWLVEMDKNSRLCIKSK
jgi:hypothetical protein